MRQTRRGSAGGIARPQGTDLRESHPSTDKAALASADPEARRLQHWAGFEPAHTAPEGMPVTPLFRPLTCVNTDPRSSKQHSHSPLTCEGPEPRRGSALA